MINDEEIDLTEHRDFREIKDNLPIFVNRNGKIFTDTRGIDNIVRKQVYGDIPWNVYPLQGEHYGYDGLVALGNKEQRAYTVETQNWGTRNNVTCDCCGKKYIKIPWKKNWGICEECKKEMHPEQIIPWQ
jgi:hypothetical protein